MNSSVHRTRRFSPAFTLVELLVVITIIGILMSLLLPAVNAARETARQLQCKNNLRQLAIGMQNHATRNTWLPTGGWYNWTGDPDRGFDRKQPGGWLYNVLPYVEQESLHDMGKDIDRSSYENGDKKNQIGRANAAFVKFLYCPTRRAAQSYPAKQLPTNMNASNLTMFGKTDYAANGGNFKTTYTGGQAQTGSGSCYTDEKNCPWYRGKVASYNTQSVNSNGVIRPSDFVSDKEIRDGYSNTIAVGEKYLAPELYETGTAANDDSVAFIGWDLETVRFGPFFKGQDGRPEMYTGWKIMTPECDEDANTGDSTNSRKPYMDTRGFGTTGDTPYFGAAHASFFHAAMIDGSVKTIKYPIALKVLGCLCNRADSVGIDPIDLN